MSTLMIILQYAAIAILFFELIYAMLQKPSDMQKYVIALIYSTVLMIAGYIIEMNATDLETALTGVGVSYIGKPYVMLFSYMFICSFYRKKLPTWGFIALAVFCIFFPIIVFSNSQHYLYYATTDFDPNGKYTPLILTHGPLYYLYIATSIVYFIACIVTVIKGYRATKGDNKRPALYTIMMILCGVLGYAVYLSGKTNGYDSTMTGIFFSVIFLFLIFFRCHVFDVITLAKDYAIEDSKDGLIVFNEKGQQVYENAAARKLVGSEIASDYITSINDAETIYHINGRTYSIFRKELNSDGANLGKSYEIADITDNFNYQTRLETAVKNTTERLERIQRTVFGSMASIVEARSLETGDHIRRVSEYSESIAKALKDKGEFIDELSDEYINMLTLSAPLHDIGKISVLDSILLKPGKLTAEEYEEMKCHSASGARIIESTMSGLEDEKYIAMARDIAMYHHEKWDGTGYPEGLKEEEIPLSARIVGLADCYDAITSKRCYKDAYPEEEAIRIIKEETGTHFDPKVVAAFLEDIERRKLNKVD